MSAISGSPPTSPPDRPWVSGIKWPLPGDWKDRLVSILLLRFASQPSRGPTADAETGLGLSPCVYWYVFRSEPRFGSIVFVWREDSGTPIRAGDGAVAPFDTGGIWHGLVRTNLAMTAAERKHFVETHSRPATAWLGELIAWLKANYADATNYIAGRAPTSGVAGIVYDTSNEAAAWSWEARLEKAAYRGQVTVRHVFWSADDRRAFEDWLETESGLDEREAVDLMNVIASATVETPATERASEEVARHLGRMV